MPDLFDERIFSDAGKAIMDDSLDDAQALIDSGAAWKLEGSVGRDCMRAIEAGEAICGPVAHADYYGNQVPAWWMLEPGTKGTPAFAGIAPSEHGLTEARKVLTEAELAAHLEVLS